MTWTVLPSWYTVFTVLLMALALSQQYLGADHFLKKPSIAFLFGMLWCCYQATQLVVDLPDRYLDKPLLASGQLTSMPSYQSGKLRLTYLIDNIDGRSVKPFQVLLTQYSYHGASLVKAQVGDYWQLTVRLKKPRGFWNPGSFDQEAWLLQQGIIATGTLLRPVKAGVITHRRIAQHTLFTPFYRAVAYSYRCRLTLKHYIQSSISTPKHLALLQTLVVGMRQDIRSSQWEVMRATGTTHLFSISGLHVGFVSGMAYRITRIVWSTSSTLSLWIPATQVAYVGAWLSAIAYSVISGFGLPIQRVLIMFTLFIYTALRRRVLPAFQSWCIALMVVLLMNPFVILSVSFWLSFSAIAIIMYGLNFRLLIHNKDRSLQKKIWDHWGNSQHIISIGLIPMSLWFFQHISILGFLANVIAIPWIGLLVIPLSLVGAVLYPIWPSAMRLLILLGEKAFHYLWELLTYLAHLPLSQYVVVIPNRWIFLTTTLSALLYIAPLGFPSRYYLSAVACLPMLLWSVPVPQPNEFWLTLLDVGQGLSAIVRTHKHVLVYDTGPPLGENNDAGTMVIVPYLRTLGIRKINTLMVSHGDTDHRGGVNSLIKAQNVEQILTSDLNRLSISRACACQQGQTWTWDGVTFSVLHPASDSTLKGNDASCVLKVSNQVHHCLLPGDVHKRGERELLLNNPSLPRVTALIAPHHGSKTSSSLAFVKRTLPSYVLFPVGYRNRFKFPHAEVIQRYKSYQSKLHSTAKEGMITIKFSNLNQPPVIESFYQRQKRFWH